MRTTRDTVVRASKFLSLILRHKPDLLRLTVDGEGKLT